MTPRRTRPIVASTQTPDAGGGREQRLCLSGKTVEAHVRSIFTKLDLAPDPDDHRRVLAVLAFLRA